MALRTPPSWLQNGSHPAENDRLTTQALWNTTGVLRSTDLAVTQAASPGMSVLVGSGYANIVGTTQANMGSYIAYNDASATLTVTTSNPSNPRIDIVVIQINDAYYTGSLNSVSFSVIAGTPAVSPVAPTQPANTILLATIAVAAGATQILNANITDNRVVASNGVVNSTSVLNVTDVVFVAAGGQGSVEDKLTMILMGAY